MFPKILSVFQTFFEFNSISVVVLVLMSTSVDCQTNQSICDFIVEDGRVRDLGLYQFIDKNERIGYRLFSREFEGDIDITTDYMLPMGEEHQLEIENGRVTAQPTPIHYFHGLHKFYGGYGKGIQQNSRLNETHFNCWIQIHPHNNTVCLSEGKPILC